MTAASFDFSGVAVTSGGVLCSKDGGCHWEAPLDHSAADQPHSTLTKESTSA